MVGTVFYAVSLNHRPHRALRDGQAEGDEEERWGFYGMVGVGEGVDGATVAVTGADPSPRELAERQRQQRVGLPEETSSYGFFLFCF